MRKLRAHRTLIAVAVLLTSACQLGSLAGVDKTRAGASTTGTALNQISGFLKSATGKKLLKGFVAIAQNAISKDLKVVTVDDNGKFVIDVEEAASFVLNFLDEESNYRGTLALGAGGKSGYRVAHSASTGAVITGIKPGNLGELALDDNGQAKAPEDDKIAHDDKILAAAQGGVGIGFKLLGAGDYPAYAAFKNELDSDGDGVVDFLDADNDNDGQRDSIDGKANGPRPDGLPNFKTVRSFGFFTNYPTQLGQSDGDYILTIDIVAADAMFLKLKEAVLQFGPSYARNATIGNRSSSPSGTTERIGVWKDQGLKLYKYQSPDGAKRIEGFLMSNQNVDLAKRMKVGDVYRFKLSYDDGTTEFLTNAVDTIFNTAPSSIKINGVAATPAGQTGVATAPTITWELLKDERGNPLKGLLYNVEIRTGNEPSPSGRVDLGVDKTEFKWAEHTSKVPYDPAKTYEIGVKAQAPGGNSSTNGIRVTGKASL